MPSLGQMLSAIVRAVENPAKGIRVLEVPQIREKSPIQKLGRMLMGSTFNFQPPKSPHPVPLPSDGRGKLIYTFGNLFLRCTGVPSPTRLRATHRVKRSPLSRPTGEGRGEGSHLSPDGACGLVVVKPGFHRGQRGQDKSRRRIHESRQRRL